MQPLIAVFEDKDSMTNANRQPTAKTRALKDATNTAKESRPSICSQDGDKAKDWPMLINESVIDPALF